MGKQRTGMYTAAYARHRRALRAAFCVALSVLLACNGVMVSQQLEADAADEASAEVAAQLSAEEEAILKQQVLDGNTAVQAESDEAQQAASSAVAPAAAAVYTVSFELNGYGMPIDPQSVTEGGVATAPDPAPESAGKVFSGWYASPALAGDPYDFSAPVTADAILYAKWEDAPTAAQDSATGSAAAAPSAAKASGDAATGGTVGTAVPAGDEPEENPGGGDDPGSDDPVAPSLADAVIAAIPDKPYTGSAIEPELTVTYDGKTLTNGTDYTVSYANNTEISTDASLATATISPSEGSTYIDAQTVTFRIVKKAVKSAILHYRNADMEEFESYNGDKNTPLKIWDSKGSCFVDVMLYYTDGTFAYASDEGVEIEWTFPYEISKTYASLETDPDEHYGVITALNTGNVAVRIRAAFKDTSFAPDVKITPYLKDTDNVIVHLFGNDVQVTPQSMTVAARDWYRKSVDARTGSITWDACNEADPPQCVMSEGEMTTIDLKASTTWTGGDVRDVGSDGYTATWSVDRCTDLDGNPVSQVLASVDENGTVSASPDNSGYAYVVCTVSSSNEKLPTFTQEVKVAVYNNHRYVQSIRIVDNDLSEPGSGLILEDGVNEMQFYVLVTYKVYDADSRQQILETACSRDEQIEGLSWGVYRGDTEEAELYSSVSETGLFKANGGFSQARLEAKVTGGGYFGQDFATSVRITREVDLDLIGSTSTVHVKIYHESDWWKLKDDAPVAREVDITREQMLAYGEPYSDWFTFRKKSEAWGTMYANGISMTSFLNLLGIDSSDLRYMEFFGSDGYSGTEGFYSAEYILATQYRYSNFYMHAVSSSPSYLGQSFVAPMIALSYCIDTGNDYDGSGYASMIADSTVRVIFGMSGVEGRNASKSVSCIDAVTIIIADQPAEPEPTPTPSGGGGGGGGGTGGGTGGSTGGGTGTNAGAATYGEDGGDGAGGQTDGAGGGTARSEGAQDNVGATLRELLDAERKIIEQATLDNPLVAGAAGAAVACVLVGALYTNRRYTDALDEGRKMEERSSS